MKLSPQGGVLLVGGEIFVAQQRESEGGGKIERDGEEWMAVVWGKR